MTKLRKTIIQYLRQGLDTREIALAVAVGIALGLFPIYGPVSLISLGVAWITRLNAPLLIAGVYAMTFVKPVLIIPFLRLGEWIFQAAPMAISLAELTRRFAEAPLHTLGEFGWSFLHATIGWMVILPLVLPLLYYGCLPLITRLDAFRKQNLAPQAVTS